MSSAKFGPTPVPIIPLPTEPLWDKTLEMDREEGEIVSNMKATRVSPYPDPVLDVPDELSRNLLITSLDTLLNWGRKSSVFPMSFGCLE